MKKLSVILTVSIFVAACGGTGSNKNKLTDQSSIQKNPANAYPDYDPVKGEGRFTNVDISPSLNRAMAATGEKIYAIKCSGCHKTTGEKLVGPGWEGVTKRHSAAWIMNFIINTDVMLDKDPKAQAQLEVCLIRMPSQNLTDDDTRAIYEFMRRNDGIK